MEMQHMHENVLQCKSCRGEGDASIWGARTSDAHDKQVNKCPNCHVFKSGTLSISSKGIGWTSWKKRWFILTRTSLVFFRSDPNAPSQKGSEVNLTLGGIDLNNSGSVVVKADKKLLTVLFPDGRDGRAFTLKAETLEDMYEWKTALENALAQAPSATLAMGQTGIFRNDVMESIEASFEQWKDKKPIKSMIIGMPVLLALEDVDGSPSFLEKALRFIEQYGVKVEGILRQSADVEEVERRVQEYEQGKNEFSPDEDAHVICDCIKHVLRELPTSPVPASCCTALLEAFRSNRAARISAIRTVVSEMLPEPNRRLLQRILMMMREVASHKSENRMAISAVAACMSPLLLRPLLAGDCVFEDAFDMGGDGSIQLLQAAAAANHAQAIVIILLEEYEKIFLVVPQEGAFSSELYSGSEDCDDDGGDEEEEEQEDEDGDEDEEDGEDGDEDEDEGDEEEITDDEILEHGGYHDAQNDVDHSTEDGLENESIGTGFLDESGTDLCGDLYEIKALEYHDLGVVTPKSSRDIEASERGTETAPSTETQHDINEELSISPHSPLPQHAGTPKSFSPKCENSNSSARITDSHENLEGALRSVYPMQKSISDFTSSVANNCQLQPAVSNATSSCATNCQLQKSVSIVTSSSADNCQLQKTISDVTSLSPTDCQLQKSVSNVTTCNSLMQKSVNNINPCDPNSPVQKFACDTIPFCSTKLTYKSNVPVPKTKRPTVWGRTSARKNLSLESIELCSDDESEIQRLETVKTDLQVKIAKEVQGNAMLQSSLEKRKEALHEHRLALEKDVKRLQEQLQKERDLRASLEAGLINMKPGHLSISSIMDPKMRADLEEIALAEADVINLKEIVSDLRGQLDQQLGQNYGTLYKSCGQQQYAKHLSIKRDQPKYVHTPVNPCYREDSPRREEVPCSITGEHVKTQKMDKPDLQNRQTSGKQCPETKGPTSTKPIGASNNSTRDVSSSNESTIYSKRSINSEEVPCSVTDEHVKTQRMDKTDLQDRQTFGKQCPETKGQASTKPIGASNCSTSDLSSSNKSTVYSKRSINSENSESLADYENPKNLEDHPDSLDKLPPEKQKLSSMSLNGGKSLGPSFSSFTDETSTAGDNAASDLSITSEIDLCGIDLDNAKRSIQDSCPPDKQTSQQHQATLETPSSGKSVDSGISISAQATLGRISASKKSLPKPEDTNVTSSSSALSRLTNRLNFLKERRVQLVNELQNLGTGHSQDPDGPPLRPSSR